MEPQQPSVSPLRLASNLIFLPVIIWSMSLELVLRKDFGRRYIDWWLLPAALWPAIFALLFVEHADPRWGSWAFWLTIGLGVIHKSSAFGRDRTGNRLHSQYDGYPHLCAVFGVDEAKCKQKWETLFCCAVAFCLLMVNESLSLFVVGGSVAMRAKRAFIEHVQNERVADLHDAYVEQQNLAERFRGGE